MENNRRPKTMERITTKALADKFIEEHMDENTKLIDFKFLPTHNIKILFLFEKTN